MNSTLNTIIVFLRIIFDKIVDYFYSLYWEDKKQPIPDLEKRHAFLAESAVTLARKIKNKELKSEDLVRAVIERIKQVNPILNAVVQDRFDDALADAKEVDRRIAKGLSVEEAEKLSFLGVPYTVKESQEVKGFRHTLGLWSRKDHVSDTDSEAVVRMRDAGAILVALTNLPELLLWQETNNSVYGLTRNPHHTGRTTGGSSGGEAALSATYATPISLCSDIGGSTRMPAMFCGMYGHLCTANTTPTKGVLTYTGKEDTMFGLGFISKHVEDQAPLIKVLAGDKACSLNLDRNVKIEDIKFYYLESSNDLMVSPMSADQKNAMKRAISKIKLVSNLKNQPVPYYHQGFDYMYTLWNYCITKEIISFTKMFSNFKETPNVFLEICKKLFGLSRRCFFTIMLLVDDAWLPKYNSFSEKMLQDLKKDLFATLGDNGVLLFPSAPNPAPYHYSLYCRPYNFTYFAIVNALKCPSTQVPLGVNDQGLPLGMQILASPYNDALSLTVAKYLENELGGSIMACKIKQ